MYDRSIRIGSSAVIVVVGFEWRVDAIMDSSSSYIDRVSIDIV